MKLYCPKCQDAYTPKSSRHHHTDGAYFGTGFPHMLFMVHPEYRPKRPANQFVPRYVESRSFYRCAYVTSWSTPMLFQSACSQVRGEQVFMVCICDFVVHTKHPANQFVPRYVESRSLWVCVCDFMVHTKHPANQFVPRYVDSRSLWVCIYVISWSTPVLFQPLCSLVHGERAFMVCMCDFKVHTHQILSQPDCSQIYLGQVFGVCIFVILRSTLTSTHQNGVPGT